MSHTLDFDAARALAEGSRLARLLAVLDRDGEETRIVGGAVRNALIGRPVQDVDLATTAVPDETSRRARAAGFKAVPTGIEHGTVTVVVEGEPFEVTTLREDVETDGRHAVVLYGRDFAADAWRRDFTINALSLARDGTVHDYADGLADLAARRLRFIGNAANRIREDYLRILRFFRFHAEYGEVALDRAGLEASIGGRDGLARLSRERVRVELLKLAAAPGAAEAAAVLEASGLLGRLVSGVGETGRLSRTGGLPPVARLGAWLVRTAGDADRLREELRLSNAEHEHLLAYAAALARLVSREPEVDEDEVRRVAVLHGAEALAAVLAATRGEARPAVTAAAEALAGRFLLGETPLPVFPLTGAALIRKGASPGPALGRRLATAREAWIAAGCPPDWRETTIG